MVPNQKQYSDFLKKALEIPTVSRFDSIMDAGAVPISTRARMKLVPPQYRMRARYSLSILAGPDTYCLLIIFSLEGSL